MKRISISKWPLLFIVVSLSCNQKKPATGHTAATTDSVTENKKPIEGVTAAGSQPSADTLVQTATPPPEDGITTVACKFRGASKKKCLSLQFSCGDFGAANISLLNDEQKKLWQSLRLADNQTANTGNPVYIGRTFEITYGMMEGSPCESDDQNQKPAKRKIPNILSFRLQNI
jgi:hypothetical protein